MKVIFFDVDDTLCRQGVIMPQSVEVLTRLKKETKHILGLATGRSFKFLPPTVMELWNKKIFDFVVGLNGQANVINDDKNTIISSYPLPKADVEKIVKICNKYGVIYQQISHNHLVPSQKPPFEPSIKDYEGYFIDKDYYKTNTLYQLSVIIELNKEPPNFEAELKEVGYLMARWFRFGADLIRPSITKFRGILDICKFYNLELKDTIAFGDGLNDIEMLSKVNLGIAMGDGWEEAKKAAKYISENIENRGIEKALIKFGILENNE